MKKLVLVLLALFSLKVCAQVPALYLSVEEVSEEPGFVSTKVKQFKVNIDYREELLAQEDIKQLNSKNSVFLEKIRIISRPLNKVIKTPKSILDRFSFDFLEFSDSEFAGYKRVSYLSNELILKKASRINFRIDLNDYLEDRQTIVVDDFITKANMRLNINGLTLDFNSLSLENGNLAFSKLREGKKSRLISDTLTITGNVTSSLALSNIIKSTQFRTRNALAKNIKPKIKKDGVKGNQILNIIKMNDEITIENLGETNYKVDIPLIVKTRDKIANPENIGSLYDSLIIPVFINAKTNDKLDITINGILRQKLTITGPGSE